MCGPSKNPGSSLAAAKSICLRLILNSGFRLLNRRRDLPAARKQLIQWRAANSILSAMPLKSKFGTGLKWFGIIIIVMRNRMIALLNKNHYIYCGSIRPKSKKLWKFLKKLMLITTTIITRFLMPFSFPLARLIWWPLSWECTALILIWNSFAKTN